MGLLSVYSRGRWTDGRAAAASGGTSAGTIASGASDIPTQDLFMGRGELETFTLTLSAVDPATGLPLDLTAFSDVIFTVKVALSDPDPGLFQKRKGAGAGTVGVLRVDPDGLTLKNQFRVWINPADTLTLQPGYEAHLVWSARAIVAAGNPQDIIGGWFNVGIGATQATS